MASAQGLHRWVAAVALLLALGGCAASDDEAGTASASAGSPPDPAATSEVPSVPVENPTPLDDHVDVATADLAQRRGVAEGEITVVTAERVTWRDSSLGCPEEGRVYSQALVDGYRIVLEVDGEQAAYHGRTGEQPTWCEDPAEDATVAEPS